MVSEQSKKWRLLRAYCSARPVWCAWQVTYRCNFRCGFCHYWKDPMGVMPEQTVEQFEAGARKLARWGTLLVSLAGGEPLLRMDLPEIVRAVGRWHFPFITTNGWRVTPDLAEELFEAGLWGASISIDYADPDRHDQARGVKGAFDRAVRALELFSRARRYEWQRVNLMMVLLDDNLDQVEPLIQLAAQYNTYFMIQPYCPEKIHSSRYRYEKNTGVGKYLLDLRRKYANFLSNPTFLSRFDKALAGGVPDCQAGRAFFNIDSTGDIAICVERRDKPVANLYRDDATTIVYRLREGARGNTCQACWYNCRGEVESLYVPKGLLQSLPTLLLDRGRPKKLLEPVRL
ncbi:MAG: radical SAM protein [Sedimentisphaerales bacterium]|nr:radical SAM protein [Sedimentisphaerales bacterium]